MCSDVAVLGDTTCWHTAIFLHIPKTSGTTLRHIIKRQYASDALYETREFEFKLFEARLAAMPEDRKAAIRCLMGHMTFGVHRYLPRRSAYITMLREPVDRVLSHYYYALRAPEHPLHRQVTETRMTLEDFVRSGILPEVNDGQVRRMCGWVAESLPYGSVPLTMLELAQRNMEQHFAAVGICDAFDASLLLFKRLLGWGDVRYAPLNVTPNRPSTYDMPQTVRRLIEEHNALDIALYDYARASFRRQLERYGIGCGRIAGFRLANRVQQVTDSVTKLRAPRLRQVRRVKHRLAGMMRRMRR